MEHTYAAVRCKTCVKTTTWLLLKYLGPDDGKATYTLNFPPQPKPLVFNIPCWKCRKTNHCSQSDIEKVSLEQAPPSGFVDQF
jgi:hypothetical protein